MTTKVKEIRQDHRGDRSQCPICTPPDKAKWISADRLWQWSMKTGLNPFRKQGKNA